jgi:hypothetical protein
LLSEQLFFGFRKLIIEKKIKKYQKLSANIFDLEKFLVLSAEQLSTKDTGIDYSSFLFNITIVSVLDSKNLNKLLQEPKVIDFS